ncbi:hypothetical protein DBR06_SOUSAS310033, partial [Sousa chinensis]
MSLLYLGKAMSHPVVFVLVTPIPRCSGR